MNGGRSVCFAILKCKFTGERSVGYLHVFVVVCHCCYCGSLRARCLLVFIVVSAVGVEDNSTSVCLSLLRFLLLESSYLLAKGLFL